MNDFLMIYQVHIMVGCGISCIMLAIFGFLIRYSSIRKKFALIRLQFTVAAFLISDAIVHSYVGIAGDYEYYAVRIFYFLTYAFIHLGIFFLCQYVTELFMSSGRFKNVPGRLKVGFVAPFVGIVLLVISQFTGMYYRIDEANCFVQGRLYPLAVIIPYVSLAIIFSFVVQYRKVISRRLAHAVFIFSIFPVLAGLVEMTVLSFSIIPYVLWLGAVILFGIALFDQNIQLSRAAGTEIVTGLPNAFGYGYLCERIAHYQDITKYNAYYFDIRRMSQVNNKYGKAEGDAIIVRYAEYIKKHIDEDEILGRLGGNFFVALIKRTNTDSFIKLLQDVPVEVSLNGKKELLHLSAIIGGYEIKDKNIPGGQIISKTATAVAYAKNVAHKPVVFLDEKLEEELESIRKLEERIRKALDDSEFEPYYQPKVDTRNNTLCGAEALARWKRDGKMVAPAEFIPVMERNGEICNLDFYILDRVCQDIKGWFETGIEPVTVSVNFSRKNLGNPKLAETISKVVEKYDIPKKLIQIEVTETLDEYPLENLIGMVNELHKYGITAAIDDFGTGSSSIRLLKDVEFDMLKIDKSFVDYDEEKDRKLLKDIISMAKNREISVIAEGVEKHNQVDELKDMDCYAIQGYVFDKPLEKAEFEKRLGSKKY